MLRTKKKTKPKNKKMSLSFIFWVTRWSYLHLGELERVLPAGPGGPLDAVGVRGVLAAQVLAVEVGRVAVAVPPGAMVEGGAVVLRVVVVAVFGGELHPVVLQQRVTCGARKGGGENRRNDPGGQPRRGGFQLWNFAHPSSRKLGAISCLAAAREICLC